MAATASALVAVVAVATTGLAQSSPSGRWQIHAEWPSRPSDVVLTVTEAEGVLSATWEGRQGSLQAQQVTFDEGVLSFALLVEDQNRNDVELRYRGTIIDDVISGSITLPNGAELPASGRRAPAPGRRQGGDVVSSADGVAIHYEVRGEPSDEATIVLVHGWSNTRSIWSRHVDNLAATHQVVTLDLAGFGDSGTERNDWSMEAFAGDVNAVVDAAGVERAVLVGFSMGGLVALQTAAANPDWLAGVVLVDVLQDPDAGFPPEARQESIEDIRSNWNDPGWVRAFAFSDATPDALVQEAIDRLPPAPPEYWWASLRAALRWIDEQAVAALRATDAPVAAINSDARPTDVEAYRTYVPTFTVRLMPGVGHLGVIWEDTGRFEEHLRAILVEMGG